MEDELNALNDEIAEEELGMLACFIYYISLTFFLQQKEPKTKIAPSKAKAPALPAVPGHEVKLIPKHKVKTKEEEEDEELKQLEAELAG